jgi:hypothetical protein
MGLWICLSPSVHRLPSIAFHPHWPSVLLLFSISRGTIVWIETVASKVHCLWNSGHTVYAECNLLYYLGIRWRRKSIRDFLLPQYRSYGVVFFIDLWIQGLGLLSLRILYLPQVPGGVC